MSSRIKGLFSSKKKKDERGGKHSRDLFSSPSALASESSFATNTRAASIASSASATDLHRDGASSQGELSVNLTFTPSSTTHAVDSISKQQQAQYQTTTTSSASKTSTSSTRPMTTDSVVEGLALPADDNSKIVTAPPSPPTSEQHEVEAAPLSPMVHLDSQMNAHTTERDAHDNPINQSHLTVNGIHGGNLSEEQNHSIVTAVYRESTERETSFYSQRQDGSFVEHRSFNSMSQMDPELDEIDGVYLNSTTEFFPVDDQDEQVYLEQYSDEGDEFPVLQYKVSKLQKQVREMRKFMRGLVQLQVEQYEPATVLIQAWWRGCLVRRELKKQRVFSWHRNPKRKVKPVKYLTRVELHQSCERISTPKASLLITEELGAEKETIAAVKLQAIFRSCLVRRRVQAYQDGMEAATVIQALWRGYRTRNLDTRLGVDQLRFRNLKIQKAFGRVSIKLQYLQGRILALEENSLPMHEAQEEINKELEDMADQMDAMKHDLEQGLKQLDEQVSEEKEQTTIELRALTERIQKLEDELKTVRSSNTNIEKQVKSLTLELPANANLNGGKSEDEDDDDYEVEYDEDGNRIERPPKKIVKRGSLHDQYPDQVPGAGPRRSSAVRPMMMDTNVNGSPQLVESPIPMQQQGHRGSVGSIHSQGHARNLSMSSQPPPSPSQFSRAFPASYSPTIANAAVLPDSGAFSNGVRPHSIPYPGASNSNNNPTRPLTMDPNQLFRFHQAANQFIPLSPSTAPPGAPGAAGFPGMAPGDTKKYASMDDFEYMQAEVDALRVNNDRLEGMVRELTMRLNSLTSNGVGQFYPG
ncbi:hypothetical protein BGZ58_007935 [Dissophora ornata]|nr:hypothetical protein BGZ58_007935 [Dissophora ornata]